MLLTPLYKKTDYIYSYKNITLFFTFFNKIIRFNMYGWYTDFIKLFFLKYLKSDMNILNTKNDYSTVFIKKHNIFKPRVELFSPFIFSLKSWQKPNFFKSEKLYYENPMFFKKNYYDIAQFKLKIKKNSVSNYYNFFFINYYTIFNINKIKATNFTSKLPLIKKSLVNTLRHVNTSISYLNFDFFKKNVVNKKNIIFRNFLIPYYFYKLKLRGANPTSIYKKKNLNYKILNLNKDYIENMKLVATMKPVLSENRLTSFISNYGLLKLRFRKVNTVRPDKAVKLDNQWFLYQTNVIQTLPSFKKQQIKIKKLTHIKLSKNIDTYLPKKFKKRLLDLFKFIIKYDNRKLLLKFKIQKITLINHFREIKSNHLFYLNKTYTLLLIKCLQNLIFKLSKKQVYCQYKLHNGLLWRSWVINSLYQTRPNVLNNRYYIKVRNGFFKKTGFLLFFNKNVRRFNKKIKKKITQVVITENLNTIFSYQTLLTQFNYFVHKPKIENFSNRLHVKSKKNYKKNNFKKTNNVKYKKSIIAKYRNKGLLSNFYTTISNTSETILYKKIANYSKFLDLTLKTTPLVVFDSIFVNSLNIDKIKIKYSYWSTFFYSWNWVFVFINDFFKLERKIDYHEVRSKLFFNFVPYYHLQTFKYQINKTFKNYKSLQEKLTIYNENYNKIHKPDITKRKWFWYKPLTIPTELYKPKPKRKLNWVLIKNHYSKTLRKERKKVDVFFKLNYRYQHRLTNWLFYFKLFYGLKMFSENNSTIVNTLQNSKFISGYENTLFILQKHLCFINGYIVTNEWIPVFTNDIILLKVNWYIYLYIIYSRKVYTYKNILLTNFITNKYNKFKSEKPVFWDFVYQTDMYTDIPYYIEIDFLTLSGIILAEPDRHYLIQRNLHKITFAPLASIFNLNWKYIV